MTESTAEAELRARARALAAEASATDPTGWFETLYAEAARGTAVVPWADWEPNPHLVEWATAHRPAGDGRRALVVGCGYGDDAEYVAGLGFEVTAFDISATAIEDARRRFPDSSVEYVAADLLATPAEWAGAFDLVVEIYTVQPLYGAPRAAAIAALPGLIAPGGTLLVIARATEETDPVRDPRAMPWPLTRAEVAALAGDVLREVRVERFHDGERLRWQAEFVRP